MFRAVQGEGHKGNLRVGALELPGKMVPGKSRRHSARYARVQPMDARAGPDVPHTAIFYIALRAEDELVSAIGLVYVEFQRLGELGRRKIKVHVVLEIL